MKQHLISVVEVEHGVVTNVSLPDYNLINYKIGDNIVLNSNEKFITDGKCNIVFSKCLKSYESIYISLTKSIKEVNLLLSTLSKYNKLFISLYDSSNLLLDTIKDWKFMDKLRFFISGILSKEYNIVGKKYSNTINVLLNEHNKLEKLNKGSENEKQD